MAQDWRPPHIPEQPSTPAPDKDAVARAEKLGFQKIDIARSTCASGNKVLVLLGLSLGLVWLQQVAPQAESLWSIHQTRVNLASRTQRVEANPVAGEQQVLRVLEASAQSELWAKVGEARNAGLKIGSIELKNIPSHWVPLIWCGGFLVLVAYLDFCRHRAIALVARALRGLRQDAQYTEIQTVEVCPGLPWWIAPLPTRRAVFVDEAQVYSALGWSASRGRVITTFAMLAFIALLIQSFTLVLAWYSAVLIVGSKIEVFVLCQLTLFAVGLTLFYVWRWTRQLTVPDHSVRHYTDPNAVSRSKFLALFTGLGAVLPVTNIFSSSRPPPPSVRRTRARWRGEPHEPSLVPGGSFTGLLNPKSGVVHYAQKTAAGHLKCLHGVPGSLSRLKPVDYADDLLLGGSLSKGGNTSMRRPHRSEVSWAVEQEVERILAGESPDGEKAARLLLVAIEHAPESLRLYDRLAVLTRDASLAEYRKRLVHAAEREIKAHPSAKGTPLKGGRWQRFWQAIIGASPSPEAKAVRKRRGANGVLRFRKPGTNDGHHRDHSMALERRLTAWKDPNSNWNRKWQCAKWRLPTDRRDPEEGRGEATCKKKSP